MRQEIKTSPTASGVTHPGEAEWMAYLYDELDGARKADAEAHLKRCRECAQKVAEWRHSMGALDEWRLPRQARRRSAGRGVAAWAAAAAIILLLGFALGRHSAVSTGEFAALKKSVGEMSARLEAAAPKTQDAMHLSGETGNADIAPLLADFSQLLAAQRAADRATFNRALEAMDLRVTRLQTELETVAFNTETGFEQTTHNLSELASFSAADHSGIEKFHTKPN